MALARVWVRLLLLLSPTLAFLGAAMGGSMPLEMTQRLSSGRKRLKRHILSADSHLSSASSGGSLVTDLAALLSFKKDILNNRNSADVRDLFAKWTGTNPCKWQPQVVCKGGRVVSLEVVKLFDGLQDPGGPVPLNGTLNPQFRTLNRLQSLAIVFLGSPFPMVLLRMTNLLSLEIGGTASIPANITLLKNLQLLTLHPREASTLPPSFKKLSKLVSVSLSGAFIGSLPSEFSKLTRLQSLTIADTRLRGPVWPHIKALSKLSFFMITGNRFTGPIPPWIGKLKSLTNLLVWDEPGLGGGIPAEIGSLPSLQTLALVNSGLTGTIPVEVSRPADLAFVFLGGNSLRGWLPAGLRTWLLSRSFLSLRNNYLAGDMDSDGSVWNGDMTGNCFNLTPCKRIVKGQRPFKVCSRIYPFLTKPCESQVPRPPPEEKKNGTQV